jgi:uncharacterized membrane protein YgcG
MHPADLMGPKTAVLVLIFAAVFLAVQATSGLVRSGISRRAVNRRLATAERTGSLGELVLELRKQRGLKEDGGLASSTSRASGSSTSSASGWRRR